MICWEQQILNAKIWWKWHLSYKEPFNVSRDFAEPSNDHPIPSILWRLIGTQLPSQRLNDKVFQSVVLWESNKNKNPPKKMKNKLVTFSLNPNLHMGLRGPCHCWVWEWQCMCKAPPHTPLDVNASIYAMQCSRFFFFFLINNAMQLFEKRERDNVLLNHMNMGLSYFPLELNVPNSTASSFLKRYATENINN